MTGQSNTKRICELLAKGMNQSQIAKELGISRQAISQRLKRAEKANLPVVTNKKQEQEYALLKNTQDEIRAKTVEDTWDGIKDLTGLVEDLSKELEKKIQEETGLSPDKLGKLIYNTIMSRSIMIKDALTLSGEPVAIWELDIKNLSDSELDERIKKCEQIIEMEKTGKKYISIDEFEQKD